MQAWPEGTVSVVVLCLNFADLEIAVVAQSWLGKEYSFKHATRTRVIPLQYIIHHVHTRNQAILDYFYVIRLSSSPPVSTVVMQWMPSLRIRCSIRKTSTSPSPVLFVCLFVF